MLRFSKQITQFKFLKSNKKEINLTHVGPSKMVNVGSKNDSLRYAIAGCKIKMKREVIDLIVKNEISKGDVLRVAEIAGIMAAKKTHEIVKLCPKLRFLYVIN